MPPSLAARSGRPRCDNATANMVYPSRFNDNDDGDDGGGNNDNGESRYWGGGA